MKLIDTYKNKKVLVLGLARSGVGAAKLLHRLGAIVTANDAKPLADNPDAQELLAEGIRVIVGSHPLDLLDEDFALMVKNPGIPYSNPMVEKAVTQKLPIITEVELAFEVSEAPWVGVTGTNGKTTTTTLIGLMLNEQRSQGQAFVAGNIGIPASDVAQKVTTSDTMVTELSSFQLMGTTQLKPKIAVLTNIFSAHLDYHGSRDNYIAAKMKIVANQTADDYFVVNWDYPELQALSKQTKAQVVPFSRQQTSTAGAYEKEGILYFRDEAIIPVEALKMPGDHNVENALAAIAVASLMGKTPAQISNVLSTFSGVKHRTQFVTEFAGRRFYNDSKATNMEATEMALKGFKQPVVWLAGGLDRGYVFDDLVPSIQKHVTFAVLFGESKELIKAACDKAGVASIVVDDLKTAIPLAYEQSKPNEIVLLSPACASWDQFANFEIRGQAFIDQVLQMEAAAKGGN